MLPNVRPQKLARAWLRLGSWPAMAAMACDMGRCLKFVAMQNAGAGITPDGSAQQRGLRNTGRADMRDMQEQHVASYNSYRAISSLVGTRAFISQVYKCGQSARRRQFRP